ncbi:MAG: ABC transporter substrate-binding protein [Alphaproteobacteria bacterium]|nr:ABC transporter substrate-binding protein [Alphaproteobacteria bacterium]
MRSNLPIGLAAGAALVAGAVMSAPASADQTLRVVMHSDLKIVDPIWTTAYMSRNYGYMVYDTLFAMDANTDVHPQMVESYEVSADKLTYTFTLRPGLAWHDGSPVTSADVIPSIQRWGSKDSMGQKLMEFVADMQAVDDRTFKMVLKEPYGLVTMSLAKPSSNVPFIMPASVAATPSSEQISEYIGSGPFVFDVENWKPGDTVLFTRNDNYQPRSESPSWASGGKVVKVEAVEWLSVKDHQTAVNSLIEGEIDYIESPPNDLLPLLEGDENVALKVINPLGAQFMFRLNHLHPPFDNVKIRRAALASINQKDFMQATIGDPAYYKECAAMFICGSALATDAGADIVLKSDFELSKQLLEEAGYDGTPIVIMQSTDVNVLNNLGPVAKANLEKGGFVTDLQAMDWQTLVARRAKREHPSEGGWNVFMTSWTAADILNPIMAAGFNAGCDSAWFGWPCDEKMEGLRDAFARETDAAKQKEIAEQIQIRAMEVVTHAHGGQWYRPVAYRSDRLDGVLDGPVSYFWNISKK